MASPTYSCSTGLNELTFVGRHTKNHVILEQKINTKINSSCFNKNLISGDRFWRCMQCARQKIIFVWNGRIHLAGFGRINLNSLKYAEDRGDILKYRCYTHIYSYKYIYVCVEIYIHMLMWQENQTADLFLKNTGENTVECMKNKISIKMEGVLGNLVKGGNITVFLRKFPTPENSSKTSTDRFTSLFFLRADSCIKTESKSIFLIVTKKYRGTLPKNLEKHLYWKSFRTDVEFLVLLEVVFPITKHSGQRVFKLKKYLFEKRFCVP